MGLKCLGVAFAAAVCFAAGCSTVAAQYTTGVPALKVDAPNGKQSTLIGSVHVAFPGLRQPADSVLMSARRYVIEHYDGHPQRAEKRADGGDRAPWAERLTDEELRVFFERTQCAGLMLQKAEEMLTYRSAQSANQYAYTVCGNALGAPSRDQWMDYAARRLGLPVDALEDADWVERQRHKVPDEVVAVGFHWILQRDPSQVLSEVVQALNAGDYERIANATRLSLGGGKGSARFEELMVHQRNKAWMPRLSRYLDEGDAVILVGAMHLPGPNGLIAMLSAKGYKVSPVLLPASPYVGPAS